MQAVPGLPEIRPGDDLAAILADSLTRAGMTLENGDILVLAHKIVSKAEGRIVRLDDVEPSQEAIRLARDVRKDPAKVELILRESQQILRVKPPTDDRESVVICEHRLGFIMANAGIDESNVPGVRSVILLPEDPDRSARTLREGLRRLTGCAPGMVISDSFGRPWRLGLVNVAIGIAGVPPVINLVGTKDAYGKPLRATVPAWADEIAAAAGLLMHKDSGTPAVRVRGLKWDESDATAREMIRPEQDDMFR